MVEELVKLSPNKTTLLFIGRRVISLLTSIVFSLFCREMKSRKGSNTQCQAVLRPVIVIGD